MSTMHDSLFGALAVRAGLLELDQLHALLNAPRGGNGKSLAEVLLAGGRITAEQREQIDQEAQKLLENHDGDLGKTLAGLSRMAPVVTVAEETLILDEQPSREAPIRGDHAKHLAENTGERVDPPTLPSQMDASTMPTIDQTARDEPGFRSKVVSPDAATMQATGAPGESLESAVETGLGHVLISTLGELPEGDTTRYTLSHVHAKGGIGQVWLARDGSMGREVALKELRADRNLGKLVLDRFIEEARITGQLEHPGVVPVYEVGRRPGDKNPYYTMKFVRGRTLGEAIRLCAVQRKSGKVDALAERRLLEGFVSICQTIAYAHARGVIHRDLKSQNVVMGDFGEVIVLDWGLARLVDDPNATSSLGSDVAASIARQSGASEAGGDVTQIDKVEGTPAYMAPEQAAGWLHKIDVRTDVYGLGAILYEILTGRPPFEKGELKELLRKVRHEEPTQPRLLERNVPAALEAVCLKALRKDPNERYQSAEELAEEVRRWLADEPVHAYPEPLTKRAARWAKKHRTAVAAAGALVATSLVALAVGNVLVSAERDEAARQREIARGTVNEMYTEVAEDWLENHLDATQKEFLEKALAYYQGFATQPSDRPELQLETARAYHRIGEIERKLGKNLEAEAAYQEAIGRLERIAAEGLLANEARHHLGRAEARLGALRFATGKLADGAALVDQAIEKLEGVVHASPDNTEASLDLARALALKADGLRLERKNEASIAAFEAAIQRLERLLAADGKHVPARKELGRVLEGLGLLQSELVGGEDAARKSLERARAVQQPLLAEFPTIPRIREDVGKTSNSLGLLLRKLGDAKDAELALREALVNYQRLATDFPDRPEYRRALSRAYNNLGNVLHADLGRLAEARRVYREAEPVVQKVAEEVRDEPKPLRDLAMLHMNLGVIQQQMGLLNEARTAYEKSLALFEDLQARFPNIPDNTNMQVAALMNQGGLLQDLGESPMAEAVLIKATDLIEPLAAAHPDTSEYQMTLADALNATGAVLAKLPERRKEASVAYARAAEVYERLVQRDPKRVEYRQGLARVLSNMTDPVSQPIHDAGEIPARVAIGRRGMELLNELNQERPQDESIRQTLAAMAVNLGEVIAEGDPNSDEAGRLFAAAVGHFEEVARARGTTPDPTLRHQLAYALTDQGKHHLSRGEVGPARVALERAVGFQRSTLAENRLPEYLQALSEQLTLLADMALNEGKHAEAVAIALDLARSVPELPEARVAAARVMARGIESVEADGTLPEERKQVEAQSYADRAVAQLRVAVDAGYAAVDAIRGDASFRTLEKREDFQAILRDATGAPGRPGLQ